MQPLPKQMCCWHHAYHAGVGTADRRIPPTPARHSAQKGKSLSVPFNPKTVQIAIKGGRFVAGLRHDDLIEGLSAQHTSLGLSTSALLLAARHRKNSHPYLQPCNHMAEHGILFCRCLQTCIVEEDCAYCRFQRVADSVWFTPASTFPLSPKVSTTLVPIAYSLSGCMQGCIKGNFNRKKKSKGSPEEQWTACSARLRSLGLLVYSFAFRSFSRKFHAKERLRGTL